MTPGEGKKSTAEDLLREERLALALNRSGTYFFLAVVFNQLPDNAFVAHIRNLSEEGWLASFDKEGDIPEMVCEGFSLIQGYLKKNSKRALEDLQDDIARDRTRIARGLQGQRQVSFPEHARVGLGDTPKAPTQALAQAQVQTQVQAQTRAQVQAQAQAQVQTQVQAQAQAQAQVQTQAQAQSVSVEIHSELSDEARKNRGHIGDRLDFMRYLTQKEAEAWGENRSDEARELLQRQQTFLQEHLASWLPGFCEVMYKEARIDFYRGIAQATRGLILHENERVPEYARNVSFPA